MTGAGLRERGGGEAIAEGKGLGRRVQGRRYEITRNNLHVEPAMESEREIEGCTGRE